METQRSEMIRKGYDTNCLEWNRKVLEWLCQAPKRNGIVTPGADMEGQCA